MIDKNKKYAVFIDIDGTLMGKSRDALMTNLETIKKVRNLGHKVFISTGRTTAHLPEHIDFINNFDGIIAGAGAYVRLGETELFKHVIPIEKVKKICNYFLETGENGLLEGDENIFSFKEIEEFNTESWIKIDNETIDAVLNENTVIMKLFIPGIISSGLIELLGDEYRVIQHAEYGEILFNKCSKATGMELVMKTLNLPISQSVAIGDSLNDLEIIERAGIGVAMGNAVDDIKNIANMITEDVDASGLSIALTEIFQLI